MKRLLYFLILVPQICYTQIQLISPIGHTSSVTDMSVLKNDMIISYGWDNSVKIWDMRTGKLLQNLRGHSSSINVMKINKKQDVLITAGSDGVLKLWNIDIGKLRYNLEGHSSSILDILLIDNDTKMISSSIDGDMKLWDLTSGYLISELNGHNNTVKSMILSKDEKTLFTYSRDNSIKIWNLQEGVLVHSLDGHSKYINDMILSNDEQVIISCSDDFTIKMWNVDSGDLIQELEEHSDKVNGILFSNKERNLISFSDDNSILIWDLLKGELIYSLTDHTENVKGILVDEDKLFSFSNDNTIKIWDINKGELIKDVLAHNKTIRNIKLIKNSNYLVSLSLDNTIKVWDSEKLNLLFSFEGNESYIKGFKITEDFKLISFNIDGLIKIWDLLTGDFIFDIKQHTEGIYDIRFSSDKKRIISCSSDHTIKVSDLETGSLLQSLEGYTTPVYGILLNQNNELFTYGYNVKVWNPMVGSLNSTFYGHTRKIRDVILLNDSLFLSYSNDNTIKVWNKNKEELMCDFYHEKKIRDVLVLKNSTRIISYGNENSIKVWDYINDSVVFNLKLHTAKINGVYLLDDENYLISFSDDSTVKIWDINNGSLIYDSYYKGKVKDVLVIEDGKKLIVNIRNNGINICSYELPYSITNVDDIYQNVNHISLSPNEEKVIGFTDTMIIVWKVNSGKILLEIDAHNDNIRDVLLLRKSNRIVSYSWDNTIKVWDCNTGKMIFNFNKHNRFIAGILIRDEEDLIISYSSDNTIKIWDLSSGDLLHDIEQYQYSALGFYDLKLNNTETEIISTSIENSIKIWNIDSGHLVHDFKGHSSYVTGLDFFRNDSIMVSSGFEGNWRLWNLLDNKLIIECLNLQKNNWITMLGDSKYYYCSKDASKMLHYVTKDLKVIGFDQLDPVYNRPDIVLDSLNKFFGSVDEDLIHQYHNAWVKRMQYLGLDTSVMSDGSIVIPYAEISNEASISYQQDNSELTLNLSAADSVNTLLRYNILINEVPLYGSTGFSLKNRSISQFDTTITISLTEGANRIQFSVFNDKNFENYKYPLDVNYQTKDKLVSNTYFIGIGVDEFIDPDIEDLSYCVQDINDINSTLSNKDNIISHLYFDEEVTRENILGIKRILLNTTVNDKVVISCSSHGLLDSINNFYLAMNDVNSEYPDQGGLKYEELLNLLDSIPARKKLLLIDACNSGNNEIIKNNHVIIFDSTSDGGRGKRTLSFNSGKDKEKLTSSSFDKMMELFVNINNPTGAIVISASGGKQSALEGDAVRVDGKQIENGAFTYSFLEFLNNNSVIKISELKSYVQDRVEIITNGKQKPTSKQETLEYDWELY